MCAHYRRIKFVQLRPLILWASSLISSIISWSVVLSKSTFTSMEFSTFTWGLRKWNGIILRLLLIPAVNSWTLQFANKQTRTMPPRFTHSDIHCLISFFWGCERGTFQSLISTTFFKKLGGVYESTALRNFIIFGDEFRLCITTRRIPSTRVSQLSFLDEDPPIAG